MLLDTSVLVRLSNRADPQFNLAVLAVETLRQRGVPIHVAPQVLVELRNVATRPLNVNGLGLAPAQADVLLDQFETLFPSLPETPDLYAAWKALVATAGVIGKQVHDARIVAICQVHHVPQILTFNVRHFAPLAAHTPNLTILDPAQV